MPLGAQRRLAPNAAGDGDDPRDCKEIRWNPHVLGLHLDPLLKAGRQEPGWEGRSWIGLAEFARFRPVPLVRRAAGLEGAAVPVLAISRSLVIARGAVGTAGAAALPGLVARRVLRRTFVLVTACFLGFAEIGVGGLARWTVRQM